MKVTKNQPPPLPPSTYTLELSEEEVTLVQTLVGITSGMGRHADVARNIYCALDSAGVKDISRNVLKLETYNLCLTSLTK